MKKLSAITILTLGLGSSVHAEESMTSILGAVDSNAVEAIKATEGTRNYTDVTVENSVVNYKVKNINTLNGVKFASKNTDAKNLKVVNQVKSQEAFNLNTVNGIQF